MSDEKKLIDCALSGFTVDASATYPRDTKPFMEIDDFFRREFSEAHWIGKLGLVGNVNLQFDDVDELRSHPLIGEMVDFKFSDLLAMFGKDRAACEGLEMPDVSGVKVKKPALETLISLIKAHTALQKFLKSMETDDDKCSMSVDFVLSNTLHVHADVSAKGVAPALKLAFNAN